MEMEFGLLGPLTVRSDGVVLPVQPGKQRAVLAALLLDAGRVVSVDDLVEVLWGPLPPASARVTVQNYVRRLRKALGPVGGARILTQPGGYVINVAAGELDVSDFEMLLAGARAAAGNAEWHTAAVRAGAALSLWRGEPLRDVPSDLLATRESARLKEMRLLAAETRIDADLHLGRHAEVIGELRRLVAVNSLRERLHALLMLALYRDNRQGEALAAYQDARDGLIEELGNEPGPELRELHQQILTGDPGLCASDRPATDASGAIVPRGLPAPVPHFSGRACELAALTRLAERSDDKPPRTVVITAIGGTAGVGKTALALHWAHQAAARFPDGQLYVNLQGFGPSGVPVRPGDAVRLFLDGLGVPRGRIPADLDAQTALYRSLLADKRVLILLDNARDAAQVRPLLPGSPACLVLVTSRNQLTGLAVDGAGLLTLDVLTEPDAREMLARRLAPGRVAAEPEAVTDLIRSCARLPLAVSIAAARAAARPGLPLTALADDLRDARLRLDGLRTGEDATDVRTVFSWSLQQLTSGAARVFRLLAVHPGQDITVPAAASLAGIPLAAAGQALAELTSAHLLTEISLDRYACHDLLRVCAAEQADLYESEKDRRAALGRILDYYVHSAAAAARLLDIAKVELSMRPPRPQVHPQDFAGHEQAVSWLRAERPALLRAVGQAEAGQFRTRAWQLAWAVAPFLICYGYWKDLESTQQQAIALLRHPADVELIVQARRCLAVARLRLDDPGAASGHLGHALELAMQLGSPDLQALVHADLAGVCDQRGRGDDAVKHAGQAVSLYRAAGDKAGEATALNTLAWFRARNGHHRHAVRLCRRALTLGRDLADWPSLPNALDTLGYAHHHLGDYADAIACYQQSIDALSEGSDPHNKAAILEHLGDAYQAAGQPRAARLAWQQALAILDQLGDPAPDELRTKLTSPTASSPAP